MEEVGLLRGGYEAAGALDVDGDPEDEVQGEDVDVRSMLPLVRLLAQRVGRSGAIVCVKTDLGAVGDGATKRIDPPDILCDDADRVK